MGGNWAPHSGEFGDGSAPREPHGSRITGTSDARSNTAKCIHAGKPGAEGVAWARNENRSSHTYNHRRWMTTWAVKIGASRATRLSLQIIRVMNLL